MKRALAVFGANLFPSPKIFLAAFGLCLLVAACSGEVTPDLAADAQQEADPKIVDWLQAASNPITSLNIDEETNDFTALTDALQNVEVVGVGEPAHGGREYYQVRLKLLKHLVEDLGFDTLVLEAGFGAAEAINTYVLTGEGDPKDAMLELKFSIYANTDFMAALEWIRAHNQTVDEASKVRIYGMETWPNDAGRHYVLSYIQAHKPQLEAEASDLFQFLASQEERIPVQRLPNYKFDGDDPLPQLDSLIESLIAEEADLVAASSASEFRQCLQYLHTMRQWTVIHVPSADGKMVPPGLSPRQANNSLAMMDAVRYVRETSGERSAKIMIWSQNYHVGTGYELDGYPVAENLGSALRAEFGEAYYAMAIEFNRGTNLARESGFIARILNIQFGAPDSDNGPKPDEFVIGEFAPAPEGSLAWYLLKAEKPAMWVDFRSPAMTDVAREWLQAPILMHFVPWPYVPTDSPMHFHTVSLGKHFDGVIFFDEVEANIPVIERPLAVGL